MEHYTAYPEHYQPLKYLFQTDMASIFIVDDEKGAIETIRYLLPVAFPEGIVLGSAQTVADAVHGIRELEPDIVFLDVQIGEDLGFSVLDQTAGLDFKVVFTTAYSEYAIRAIRYSAADYLLKPLGPAKLKECMERIMGREESTFPTVQTIRNVLADGQSSMIIPDLNGYNVLQVGEIIRCESDNNYTRFCLRDGRKLIATSPLKYYERLLPEHLFFRIHKSHMIQRKYVRRVDKGEGGLVEVEGGDKLPISRRRKPAFWDWLRL